MSCDKVLCCKLKTNVRHTICCLSVLYILDHIGARILRIHDEPAKYVENRVASVIIAQINKSCQQDPESKRRRAVSIVFLLPAVLSVEESTQLDSFYSF